MLELWDFVAETLKQIIDGTRTAQEYAPGQGARVNPNRLQFRTDQGVVKIMDIGSGAIVQEVNFDVAVTATEGKTTQGGIGVFVAPVALGSKGKSEASNQSLSRVQFSVPLCQILTSESDGKGSGEWTSLSPYKKP